MTKTEHPSTVVRYGFIAAFAPLMWIELFRDVGEDWRVYEWTKTELVALAFGMVLWVGVGAGIITTVELLLNAVGL